MSYSVLVIGNPIVYHVKWLLQLRTSKKNSELPAKCTKRPHSQIPKDVQFSKNYNYKNNNPWGLFINKTIYVLLLLLVIGRWNYKKSKRYIEFTCWKDCFKSSKKHVVTFFEKSDIRRKQINSINRSAKKRRNEPF